MNKINGMGIALVSAIACRLIETKIVDNTVLENIKADFTLAFGSCNKTKMPNKLWDDVIKLHPDVWAWGGDIIYADTENMERLRKMYDAQNKVPAYILI